MRKSHLRRQDKNGTSGGPQAPKRRKQLHFRPKNCPSQGPGARFTRRGQASAAREEVSGLKAYGATSGQECCSKTRQACCRKCFQAIQSWYNKWRILNACAILFVWGFTFLYILTWANHTHSSHILEHCVCLQILCSHHKKSLLKDSFS